MSERKFKKVFGVGFLSFIIVAFGSSAVADEFTVLTQKMVDQANIDYACMVVKGDVSNIQYRYSNDAILIGHGGMFLQGRSALNEHFQKSLKVRPVLVTVTSLSLEKAGDKYIEVGESRGEGASGVKWLGHYMAIWQYQDGQWLIEKNIYN